MLQKKFRTITSYTDASDDASLWRCHVRPCNKESVVGILLADAFALTGKKSRLDRLKPQHPKEM